MIVAKSVTAVRADIVVHHVSNINTLFALLM